MKRLPMMLQLVLIFVGVMLVPISILTWYSGSQIIGYSENAIASTSMSGLASNKQLNENALNFVSQNTVRLASTNLFDGIRNYTTYDQLNAHYTRVENGISLQKELQRLMRSNDGLYSAYFYMDNADYVVSSDKGITLLERYESIDWLNAALENVDGIAGVWVPRVMSSEKVVLSYILPLNRLSTSTKGVLVVNLDETQISSYMNASNDRNQSYFILEKETNTVISHQDQKVVMKNISDVDPVAAKLVTSAIPSSGYEYWEQDGERTLYTWQYSDQNQWLYVQVNSMAPLMSQTAGVQKSIIIITMIIIAAGTLIALFLATWLSKPVRDLANRVGNRGNTGVNQKNELAFLNHAFVKMQEEEVKLNTLIREHEQDACTLSIHHTLRGESQNQKKKDLFKEVLPHRWYSIALVSIDQYGRYVSTTSPETRAYHRYLFSAYCEAFQGMKIKTVYYGEGRIAVVINDEEVALDNADKLKSIVETLHKEGNNIFGHSITIGVSSPTDCSEELPQKLLDAMELIKHRMMKGNGRIIYWRAVQPSNMKYIYPLNNERRIINYLDAADFDNIEAELRAIRADIESAEYISYDNILFIYNQLIGVTIKHLNEKNINTSAIFAERGNIYSIIASIETLQELEQYIKQFFDEISKYVQRDKHEGNHIEKIIAYLDENYSTDIVFEQMAKDIGISYSYMRKLVYESTGKSLIDYINHKRIQAAKGMLIKTTLNVAQIAAEVGYNNIQSFNRFFRKFEGVTPSSYKSTNMNG